MEWVQFSNTQTLDYGNIEIVLNRKNGIPVFVKNKQLLIDKNTAKHNCNLL